MKFIKFIYKTKLFLKEVIVTNTPDEKIKILINKSIFATKSKLHIVFSY